MSSLQNFIIEFESRYGVCHAGQPVIGAVCFQLSDGANVTGVSLKLLGRAKVHWSVQVSESATEHYSAEEIYINEEVYVFGSSDGESNYLEAGSHRFPFTFLLPPTVPSSFEGVFGHVRYTAKAKVMERPWKCKHVTREMFTVISIVDLNMEPLEFREPCETNNDAVVECCCWSSGTVSSTLRLNKTCFVPGESILINAEIVNNSQTDITSTRASLKQHVEFLGFYLGAPHSKCTSSYVTSCKGPGVIAAGTTGTWNNVPMLIRPTAPSRLIGCGIININYALKFYVHARCTNLKLTLDILIGPVPLREAVHSLPAAQCHQVITSQPLSARPPDQPDINIFNLLPPSYEECTAAGEVDICEENDDQS